MQAESDFCAQLVREADKDRYLATLFAPAARRGAMLALYAFDGELARIRTVVRQPVAGEIRLQWWHEVVEGGRPEEAQASPVAAALLSLVPEPLPRQLLLETIEARAFDLYDDPMPTLAAFEGYARRTVGAVMLGASRILSPDDAALIAALAESAGIAVAIVETLRQLPRHASRGQLYVPIEVLDRHGAPAADIYAGRTTPALLAALAEMRVYARRHLAAAADLLQAAPREVLPAVLPAAAAPLYLDRMERRDYDPFRTAIEVPQWRRQWALWRAARKLPR